MKLFKKLIAVVAMAAICLSMTAPVSADAATEDCGHSYLRKTQKRVYVGTSKHIMGIEMDVNNQEPDEIVIYECNKIIYDVWDVYLCMECNKKMFELYFREEYHHSTLCPFYGGYYRVE